MTPDFETQGSRWRWNVSIPHHEVSTVRESSASLLLRFSNLLKSAENASKDEGAKEKRGGSEAGDRKGRVGGRRFWCVVWKQRKVLGGTC